MIKILTLDDLDDVTACYNCANELFAEGNRPNATRDDFLNIFNSDTMVGSFSNSLEGFISYSIKNDVAFINSLYVDKSSGRKGLGTSLANNEMRTHIIYFKQKAWCLMKMGHEDEGRELYKKFLMLAYVMDGYASVSFEAGKREYEETFGGKLELSVEW